MTPDQYRREGAEAMRAYIANGCDPSHLSRSDNPTEFHAGYRHAAIQRFTAIRAIDVDEVLAGMPPVPVPVARLVEAARALGAMPEGYCFCSANRVGDDSKIHEPECADLRAALAACKERAMTDHQYFTVEPTACTIPKRGALAIYCGDAPRRNEAEGTTSYSLRGPLLIIPPDMWGDPEGIAEKVAKVLNDNASLFFDSAKIDKTETSRDRT